MTDYERDLRKWKSETDEQILNGCGSKEPDRTNYDEKGNKLGTQYTEKGNPIDPYLVSTYGIEYAKREADLMH